MALTIARITGGRSSRQRRVRILRQAAVVTVALLLGAWLAATWPAPAARADDSQYDVFYNPPDVLPGQPGDVIRDEPSRIVLEPSGQLGGFRATGVRIMYDSSVGDVQR